VRSEALAWAERALGAEVTDAVELEGGMTSTMLALVDATGRRAVLRLMTQEPWRTHGAGLTRREQDAFAALAGTSVPAPVSIALDADGTAAGVAAHLMTHLPGRPTEELDTARLATMAGLLAEVHTVRPDTPFRTFETWAWEAKWQVPSWTRHADSWRVAFELLAGEAPAYEPAFLHRDFSHRNLLWDGPEISGVVDWVETSTGPRWLDAGHAATNLAVAFGPEPARSFLAAYADHTDGPLDRHWLVMDTVGFLSPPGKAPMFGEPEQLQRLDDWLHEVVHSDRWS
jgi:aminoglycoside phosphotransferase (APT) family kinase protein